MAQRIAGGGPGQESRPAGAPLRTHSCYTRKGSDTQQRPFTSRRHGPHWGALLVVFMLGIASWVGLCYGVILVIGVLGGEARFLQVLVALVAVAACSLILLLALASDDR